MTLDIDMEAVMSIKYLLIVNYKEMYFKTIFGIHMLLLLIEVKSKSHTNEICVCVFLT